MTELILNFIVLIFISLLGTAFIATFFILLDNTLSIYDRKLSLTQSFRNSLKFFILYIKSCGKINVSNYDMYTGVKKPL